MRRLSHPFARTLRSARRPLPPLAVTTVLLGMALAAPQYAAAEATSGPEATEGAQGLPDGRVYEEVSPVNKPGTEAVPPRFIQAPTLLVLSGPAGNEVAFSTFGPMGEALSGFEEFSVARRSSSGWHTRAGLPRAVGPQGYGSVFSNPTGGVGFSSDMSRAVFSAHVVFLPEAEEVALALHLDMQEMPDIYRYSEGGLVQWLAKPTIATPVVMEQAFETPGVPAGASPDYSTLYYTWQGALVPEDEEPNPALGNVSYVQQLQRFNEGSEHAPSDDSYYEWREGVLKAVGILPNGHLDPYGATPAATLGARNYLPEGPEGMNNQVSEDGREAFFVSPDPASNSGRPPQLYVRITAPDGSQSTKLVSRDPLLPEEEGLPAKAPDGVHEDFGSGYMYASPDGSRVFFGSVDRLTEAAPNDTTLKAYEFDVATGALTYLPGLSGLDAKLQGDISVIFASSRNGSRFLFAQKEQLALWSEGTARQIAPIEYNISSSPRTLARATPDGSVFVLDAKSAFPEFSFNNGNGAVKEIYRYEAASNTLSCISCPPQGVTPSGDAILSWEGGHVDSADVEISRDRSISEDGSRVFFDTPDPLVRQDANGLRDVYEWEAGSDYLISSGIGSRDSYVGDNSPSGDDEFFSTAEGIVPGDTDGSYDLYDARVPHPGDQPPPSAVPCEGAVCQGPPSVPQLLSPPGSETFNGAGDLSPAGSAKVTVKSLTRKQKLVRALRACKRKRNTHKRAACERRARRRYGAKASRIRQGRHGNGRGK